MQPDSSFANEPIKVDGNVCAEGGRWRTANTEDSDPKKSEIKMPI